MARALGVDLDSLGSQDLRPVEKRGRGREGLYKEGEKEYESLSVSSSVLIARGLPMAYLQKLALVEILERHR